MGNRLTLTVRGLLFASTGCKYLWDGEPRNRSSAWAADEGVAATD